MRRSVNRLKTRNIGNVIRQPASGEMSAVFPRRGKGGKHWVMGGGANVSSRPNDSAGLGSDNLLAAVQRANQMVRRLPNGQAFIRCRVPIPVQLLFPLQPPLAALGDKDARLFH